MRLKASHPIAGFPPVVPSRRAVSRQDGVSSLKLPGPVNTAPGLFRKKSQGWSDAARQGRSKAATAKADEFAREMQPIIAALRSEGFVRDSEFRDVLNKLRIRTQRGCDWTGQSIRNLLERIERLEPGASE